MVTAKELTARVGGDWCGTYGLIPGPGHSQQDRSVKVWDGPSGPMFHSFANDNWRDIRDHFKECGALSDDFASYLPPSNSSLMSPKHEEKAEQSKHAKAIWKVSFSAQDSAVETYLRERGIEGDIPTTLRCRKRLKHARTGTSFPAMIAAVTVWPNKEVVAVHRTYLRGDGAKKAPVTDAKKMLGPCKGGAVRLGQIGADNKATPFGLVEWGDALLLGEGIETVLSAMQMSGLPGWACLSTSGLKSVVVPPPEIQKRIVIAVDNDRNDAGQAAADELQERLARAGHEVKQVKPPKIGTDFNDVLMDMKKNAV